MKISFLEHGWEDYNFWAENDIEILKRINALIKDIKRSPFKGIGKPEPLKQNYKGFWSRRITIEHRLIYCIDSNEIVILKCRFHYD